MSASAYYCYVRFADGSAVVPHTHVKNFKPVFSTDFKANLEYDVSWQDGQGSFDGYYKGKIVCMGASLDELKENAKNMGIRRMPSNFSSLLRDPPPPDTPPAQSKRKSSEAVTAGKRRRMMATLADIVPKEDLTKDVEKCEKKKEENDVKKVKKAEVGEKQSVVKKVKKAEEGEKQSVVKKAEEGEKQSVLKKVNKTEVGEKQSVVKKLNKTEVGEKQIDVKKVNKTEVGEKQSVVKKVNKTEVGEKQIDVNKLNKKSDVGEKQNEVKKMEAPIRKEDETEEEADKQFDMSYPSDEFDDTLSTSHADMLLSKIDKESDLESVKQDSSSSSEDGFSDEDEDDPTGKLVQENLALKASCKLSEKGRLVLYSQCEDLKRELAESKEEIEKLKQENHRLLLESKTPSNRDGQFKKLNQLLITARDLLVTGVERYGNSSSEPVFKNSFSDKKPSDLGRAGPRRALFQDHDRQGDKRNRECYSEPVSKNAYDKKHDHGKQDSFSLTDSPQRRSSPSKSSGSPSLRSSPTPPISKKNVSRGLGLTHQEILEISERVRKDITGEELMAVDSKGKIHIGGGLSISKDKWSKGVKVQSKNSLFITKLSQATYGSEALKMRTVGVPKEDGSQKKAATPAKVDAFVGCLRGKILAENPNFPNVDEAAVAAKVILSRKMQDEARQRVKKEKL